MRAIPLVTALAALAATAPPAPAQGAAGIELRFAQKIPLRDGVRLNAVLYLPRGGEPRRPAILALTPYTADSYHRFVLPIVRRGYAVVVADVRGRGGSEGRFTPFVQEAADGYDAVEWIAAQPWCDGKVGMMGGSYGGFDQWATAKEGPPHLVTIAPTAAPYMGIDWPALGGIWPAYMVQWLAFTSDHAAHPNVFGDWDYWRDRFRVVSLGHLPFASLDSVAGYPSAAFQAWLRRPEFDDYWAAMAPSPDQLARLAIPIFTRTGIYDNAQIGALEHYRQHMRHGSPEARARHYLMIGPWDHGGTRTPDRRIGGLEFGDASLLDLGELEADWYDWTIRGGARPARLPRRVAYYVTGAETWKYADDLDDIGRSPTTYYLSSPGRAAGDVFHAGVLATSPADARGDRWTDDPLDLTAGGREGESADPTDQTWAADLGGRGVVYHSAPYDRPTEISGFPRLEAWITMDVPDADLWVGLYEITARGGSILLDETQLRARYRESRRRAVLVTPGEPTRFVFDRFRFMSRRLAAGSRVRLLIRSPSSILLERNYHGGGAVAFESGKDARTAHLELLHEPGHRSVLLLPVTPDS